MIDVTNFARAKKVVVSKLKNQNYINDKLLCRMKGGLSSIAIIVC